MTDSEQKTAAKEFANFWQDKGYEKGQSQSFWLSLLQRVFGIEHPEEFITFEEQVHLDHTSFIDATIPATKVLIEQKGSDKDLRKAIKQSDGTLLSPFQQAKRYITELPVSKHPRWVVTCNFKSFLVYDMENPQGEPEEILLKNLPKEYYRLSFLVDSKNEQIKRETEVSIEAGKIVGLLYDAFHKQYADPDSEHALKSLNKLCVRLVFCLYAEDAGIFGHHSIFHDYMEEYDTRHMRRALVELFKVLDTPEDKRDPYLKDDNPSLAAFPYVNGGLFTEENIDIPPFTDEIRKLLLENASRDFDWSEISPTIFGAVFESTLNPETRRSGGMHYTSVENIHKVIDPLFLDDLKKEFERIQGTSVERTRVKKLKEFHDKLSSLVFLDPACGSGNFLTETYLSLRHLENDVIYALNEGQMKLGGDLTNLVKVSIEQFYGIEINDFAVTVAKTALWIAESQMLEETRELFNIDIDFLPLKSYTNIMEGNALRIDWESVVPKNKLNYIMGNPPFIGARLMSSSQKDDVFRLFEGVNGNGNLDYVACWYKKATDLMNGTNIRTALVSTNSITQGEQVPILWKKLFEDGVHIDFAYRTFRWDSEAKSKAHVHCVIVGFSRANNTGDKRIFDNGMEKIAANINGYLVEAENIVIESRTKPLCKVPEIGIGNQPIDDGNYLFTEEEMLAFIKKEPMSKKYFKKWLGAKEFINGYCRYCLWLGDTPPEIISQMPECMKRVKNVREFRLSSKRKSTYKLAETPTRFQTENMPDNNYLLIPRVSSENRRYVPIGYISKDTLVSDSVHIIPNATLYHFGILTSNVHMGWMRAVAGRLEMRYRYSKDIVYNNFPWPNPTKEQKAKIEQTAQAILDARKKYPECSLADLYGEEMYIYTDLLKAHQANDRAVMQAYGFSVKDMTESECVAELMKMYQKLARNK